MGYKLEHKELIVIPDEAKIIRLIFELYVAGHGADTIGKILDSKGIKPKKSSRWNRSSIMTILSNHNYTSDLILQKTFRDNHLSKRKVINTGELDRYIVKNNHEAIISQSLFNKVQKMRRHKSEKIQSRLVKHNYPFKGKIRCGICGRVYTHKRTPHNEIWKCSLSVTKGKEACNTKQVPHGKVLEACIHILNKDQYSEAYFNSKVNMIIVMPNRTLQFQMKDGMSKDYKWKQASRSDSWTPEMKEQARIRVLNQLNGGIQNG